MPRKQKKYHYIYKTTCDINGKFYYGMHSTSNLEDGYIGSGTRLWHSINKHGKENHSIEILEYFENREILKSKERELVNEDMLNDPMCMNLCLGGEGGWETLNSNSDAQRSKGNKGRAKMRILEETDPEWVAKRSKSLSDARKLEYRNGTRIINPPDWTGRKHSEKSIEKMKASHEGKHNGSKNSQFGTCWIHKNGMTTKIKKEDLESSLRQGWTRGRK